MSTTVSPTRKCSSCGNVGLVRATVPHATELKHDGTTYPIQVEAMPAIQCPHCNAVSFTDEAFSVLDRALRETVRLMSADAISTRRRLLKFNKRTMARQLRMAAETVTRVERGTRVQSASYDLFMQLFLASGYLRWLIAGFHEGKDLFALARDCEGDAADLPCGRSVPGWLVKPMTEAERVLVTTNYDKVYISYSTANSPACAAASALPNTVDSAVPQLRSEGGPGGKEGHQLHLVADNSYALAA
jgi:DNA-binding transcriptional regulator YiaG